MVRGRVRVRTLTLTLTRSPLELAAQLGHVEIVALFEQVSSCGSRTFLSLPLKAGFSWRGPALG